MIRLGVEMGNLQKQIGEVGEHLYSMAICGLEKEATWEEYVIYGTLIVWSMCSFLDIDAGEVWRAEHFSFTLWRI